MSDVFSWTIEWAEAKRLPHWSATETESTNTIAKNDDSSGVQPRLESTLFSEPTVYLARRQSAGRGRGSHIWTTPDGSALLSSWSFAIARVPQPIFSALVGLALYEACATTWPTLEFNIKAPNDLFIGAQKTAGILIETIDSGREKRTVIGVGLNAAVAPQGMATATSLAAHLDRPVERGEWSAFLDAWLLNLKDAVAHGMNTELTPDHCLRLARALNLHPLLKEPILKVDEFGQLHSASRVIHWHEL